MFTGGEQPLDIGGVIGNEKLTRAGNMKTDPPD
jgi:hypothetical protein